MNTIHIYLILFIVVSCERPIHIHNKNCLHWRVIVNSDGIIRDSMSYNFDSTICHGKEKIYDNDGKLKEIINYYYGKREGKSILLYENGCVMQVDNYSNDIFQGYSIKYFENGNIKEFDSVADGRIYGLSWLFDKNGKLIRKGVATNKNILKTNGYQYKEYFQ